MDIKALGMSQLSGLGQTMLQLSGLGRTVLQLLDRSVLQLRVTALFYLEDNRKIHLQGMRARRSKDSKSGAPQRAGERERASQLWFLFLCFSLPGPVLCKLCQPGVLFVLPEVLTPVLGPSFVLFLQAFPSQVFQPPPFWTPFPYSNYLTTFSNVLLRLNYLYSIGAFTFSANLVFCNFTMTCLGVIFLILFSGLLLTDVPESEVHGMNKVEHRPG